MLFKKKPLSPVGEISHRIDGLSDDLMKLKKEKAYRPSPDDLRELTFITEKLHHAYAVAGYVERCLHQRAQGEPESAKKFTDPDVFNYHYPQ